MSKLLKKIIIGILILCFLLVCGIFEIPQLLYSEINTLLFADEFDDPELFSEDTGLSEDIDKIKVLSYWGDHAKVYYLTDNYQNAAIFDYKKMDGKWQYDYGYFLWTDDGGVSNIDGPFAYWWYDRLRDKNMPLDDKYGRNDSIETDDIIRHPKEPVK